MTEASERKKLESLWETIADEERDVFESRRSLKREIPETLPRFGIDGVDTLPPLNPSIGGKHTRTIDFVRMLRQGGMGEIHIAQQKPMGRRVAVKRLRHNKRSDRHRQALLEEGWITGRLQHPNIVPVYTLGLDEDDQPAIVMKLIEGVSLAEILADFDKLPQVFEAESQLESHIEILIQVCNAISYTHDQGVIHRDIKPSNIMVGEYGEVYLLDWGIATQVGPGLTPFDGDDTRRGAEGTPAYMAPEMAAPSFAELSRQTDIFLLGACLHEILTGEAINCGESYFDVLRNAFERNPPEYGFDVPDELAQIASRALARKPRDRFRTVVEFRKSLRDFLNFQTSWRLSEVARSKLVVLEDKIESQQLTSRNELYPLFGACRFGFQHALEVRPENETALEGLQRAVESMIRWELEHGGASAAEILLNALPTPNPDLSRRVAEAVAERQREQQESLFTKMSPDAVLAVDADGEIVYANEQTVQIFGWDPDALVGQKVEVLVPEAMHEAHKAYRDGYADAPTRRPMGSDIELEGVHRDGSRVPVDISLAPVQLNGELVTLASIRPTRRPVTASEFAEENSSLKVLNALAAPIFFLHAGRLVWANDAFVDCLDYETTDGLLGASLEQLFPEDQAAIPTEESIEADGPTRLEDVRVRTADGATRSLDLRFSSSSDLADTVLAEVVGS